LFKLYNKFMAEVVLIPGMACNTPDVTIMRRLGELLETEGALVTYLPGVEVLGAELTATTPSQQAAWLQEMIEPGTDDELTVVTHSMGALAAPALWEADGTLLRRARFVCLSPPIPQPSMVIGHSYVQGKMTRFGDRDYIGVVEVSSDYFQDLAALDREAVPRMKTLADMGRLSVVTAAGDWNRDVEQAAADFPIHISVEGVHSMWDISAVDLSTIGQIILPALQIA
jgi:hypothetical protein